MPIFNSLNGKMAEKHKGCAKAEVKTLYSHFLKGIVKVPRGETHITNRLRHTKKSIFQVWAAIGELHDCKQKNIYRYTTTKNTDNKVKK